MKAIRLKHKESAIRKYQSKQNDINGVYHVIDSKVNEISINDLINELSKLNLSIESNSNFSTIKYEDENILNAVSSYNNENYPLHKCIDYKLEECKILLHNGIKPIILECPSIEQVLSEVLKEVKKYQ